MKELNGEQIRRMLIFAAERIIESKSRLTEIDSKIGDGDHGIGMAGGMEKVIEVLSGDPARGLDPYGMFRTAGNAMLMSMGGASGVIFGSMYLGGAKGYSKEVMSPDDFACFFQRSLDVIRKRGGASVGDKTMVDALSPAVDAMLNNRENDFSMLLAAAEEAAWQGVEDTKKYIAKYGRAKSLGERAVGCQDAGATSVAIIFEAMCDCVKQIQTEE